MTYITAHFLLFSILLAFWQCVWCAQNVKHHKQISQMVNIKMGQYLRIVYADKFFLQSLYEKESKKGGNLWHS